MQLFRRNREQETKDIGAAIAQQAAVAGEQAQRLVNESVDQASRALEAAKAQGAQVTENASEALDEWRSSIESMVRQQPVTALALAALAGMAFGALWRYSDK